MRFNRTTWLFLGGSLGIILLAVLFLSNQPKPTTTSGTPTSEALRPLFGGANVTDIVSFSVHDEVAAADTTYKQQSDGTWSIETSTTGKNGPLTQSTIDNAVAAVINLQSSQFAAANLGSFGLDKPNATIRFKTKAGDESVLKLGNRNPAGTSRYALVNGDSANVYLINASQDLDTIVTLAGTPPIVLPPTPTPVPSLQLPGPLFGQFDPYSIGRLEMVDNKSSAKLILLRDATTNWIVEEATNAIPGAAVDNSLVSVILNAFGLLQGTTAIPVADLSTVGLDKPSYTITVTASNPTNATGPDIRYHIDVGNTDPSGALTYVKVEGYNDVAMVLTRDLQLVLTAIKTPPYLPATPEATSAAAVESTAAVTAAP